MRIVTVPVFAARYLSKQQSTRTHAARVLESGVLEPLCTAVKPDSLMDDETQWSTDPPSCPACRRRLEKLNR
jgi:hypothetical protein